MVVSDEAHIGVLLVIITPSLYVYIIHVEIYWNTTQTYKSYKNNI